MTTAQALIIAIVEGLTEFLPISSTAHMIFASTALGIEKDEFVKLFTVSIQFGAILAVVALYWKRFFNFSRPAFYVKLAAATVPALVLGYLFDDAIEAVLEKPLPIAMVLILGGIVLLFIDKIFHRNASSEAGLIADEKDVSVKKAVIIGFWQCLAMMPGTSRAAASIIGGMQQRLTRGAAAEFSFFLAVPTMLAVTAYSVFLKHWHVNGVETKGYELITADKSNTMYFLIGNLVAFVVAAVAIRFFIGFLKKYGFKVWGWYRIIAGAAIIALLMSGNL
jgi:undecaprenyl-diphosphatase